MILHPTQISCADCLVINNKESESLNSKDLQIKPRIRYAFLNTTSVWESNFSFESIVCQDLEFHPRAPD